MPILAKQYLLGEGWIRQTNPYEGPSSADKSHALLQLGLQGKLKASAIAAGATLAVTLMSPCPPIKVSSRAVASSPEITKSLQAGYPTDTAHGSDRQWHL